MHTPSSNVEKLQLPDHTNISEKTQSENSENMSQDDSEPNKHLKETTVDMPDIDWKEKNFPPGVNLINFKIRNLKGRIRSFSQKCYWGFVTLVFWWVFNLITTILQWAILWRNNNGIRLLYC